MYVTPTHSVHFLCMRYFLGNVSYDACLTSILTLVVAPDLINGFHRVLRLCEVKVFLKSFKIQRK